MSAFKLYCCVLHNFDNGRLCISSTHFIIENFLAVLTVDFKWAELWFLPARLGCTLLHWSIVYTMEGVPNTGKWNCLNSLIKCAQFMKFRTSAIVRSFVRRATHLKVSCGATLRACSDPKVKNTHWSFLKLYSVSNSRWVMLSNNHWEISLSNTDIPRQVSRW